MGYKIKLTLVIAVCCGCDYDYRFNLLRPIYGVQYFFTPAVTGLFFMKVLSCSQCQPLLIVDLENKDLN